MTETKYIEIDPANTPLPQLHQFLLGSVSPRPICFASTIDLEGRPNLAPFSFFNVCGECESAGGGFFAQ